MATGFTALAAIIAGASLLALPIAASAFWPFFSTSYAANAGGETPLVHDGSLTLLAAAVNSDPNPEKGDSTLSMTEGSALIANSGPGGTIADVVHGSADAEISTYTVVEGDTFSSIATKNGISVNTVLWANNMTSKSTLKVGTTLVILPVTGIEHKVLKGETVASLAKKYGGAPEDIIAINGLEDASSLTVGTMVIIPDGEPAEAPTPAKIAVKASVKRAVSLPSVGGFSNPLPGGICTQGIHDHNGVDIGAPAGTPIYASAGGSVIIARMGWNGGFGNYVVINHPNGAQTLYAHMTQLGTSEGASVGKGELIGYVGSTGKSTGNHLHFEIHKAANPFCSNL